MGDRFHCEVVVGFVIVITEVVVDDDVDAVVDAVDQVVHVVVDADDVNADDVADVSMRMSLWIF